MLVSVSASLNINVVKRWLINKNLGQIFGYPILLSSKQTKTPLIYKSDKLCLLQIVEEQSEIHFKEGTLLGKIIKHNGVVIYFATF